MGCHILSSTVMPILGALELLPLASSTLQDFDLDCPKDMSVLL